MKHLSDYKGEDSIEIWADILEDVSSIITDNEVLKTLGQPIIVIASAVLKNHSKEVEKILLRIDDTPLDGRNVVSRLIAEANDLTKDQDIADFFGLQGQSVTKEFSGSATENTKAKKS